MEKKEGDKTAYEEEETSWDGDRLIKYQGFWYPHYFVRPILSAQNHFKAKDGDLILATLPKSGTTWLKALASSVANRRVYTVDQSPLLTSNPHQLVPFFEFNLYLDQENPDLEHMPSPRMFATHIPFETLPYSIRGSSECRIIYVCRNPLDQVISNHHFMLDNKRATESLELCVDKFCEGVFACGPFWDHVLGYWNAHLENPKKVLFLKYEDMKADITSNVKKIAEFMGCPFTSEEEERGAIEEIVRLCSFDNLKNLEVNKSGYMLGGLVKNSSYFRKGQVGDWINELTPAMAERMRKLVEIKFEGSGLTFNNI